MASGQDGADFRRIDVDDIGQFMLGVVRDADRARVAFDADPLVGFGILQIIRNIHVVAGRGSYDGRLEDGR